VAVREHAAPPAIAVKLAPIAGGLYHSLALTPGGAVWAWGWDITGQLCNGNAKGSDVPQKVRLLGGTRVVAIAAGFAHTMAVTSTGAVLNCGKNDDGELGNGGSSDSAVPVKVDLPAGTKVTAVSAGAGQSLALTASGEVLAWGLNLYGALGNGSMGGSSATPVNVSLPPGTKVTAIAAGSLHSLALTSTGAVLAWGFNTDGELGDGGTVNSDVPVTVKLPAGTRVTAIAAGGYYSLALTSTGKVLAWGYNADGELGDGVSADSYVPVNVKLPAGTKATAIAAGGPLYGVGSYVAGPGHSLAIISGGRVLAWGDNADGQLGDGTTANSYVPVRVKLPPGMKVTSIAAGQLQSLAVTSRGAVLAWGGNNFGQLGDGSYKGSDVPVHVDMP